MLRDDEDILYNFFLQILPMFILKHQVIYFQCMNFTTPIQIYHNEIQSMWSSYHPALSFAYLTNVDCYKLNSPSDTVFFPRLSDANTFLNS